MTIFTKKSYWDSILPELTKAAKADSRFINGRKGTPRSLSYEFEELTNTYLPPLIKSHTQNYFKAEGHFDFADSGLIDDNENMVTLNTKASSQHADVPVSTPCITHGICAFKPLYDYFKDNRNNYYILLRYNTTERGGKTYILDTEAIPLHFIPTHDIRVSGVGWGSLTQSHANPKKAAAAALRGEMRGRTAKLKHDVLWRGAPSTQKWADAIGEKAVAFYERRRRADQKKMEFFQERVLTNH